MSMNFNFKQLERYCRNEDVLFWLNKDGQWVRLEQLEVLCSIGEEHKIVEAINEGKEIEVYHNNQWLRWMGGVPNFDKHKYRVKNE